MTTRTVTKRGREIRRKGPVEFGFQEQDVRQISRRLQEPEWLTERRLQAWQSWQSMPTPSVKEEAWRRTDLSAIPSDRFNLGPADGQPVDPHLLEPLAAEKHGALLVLQPGVPPKLEGDPALDTAGVVLADWSTAVRAHAQILQKHLGTVVDHGEGKFAALAAALADQGVLVYIPAGLQLEQPLHSVLWAPGGEKAFLSRVLVVVEPGATATYVHETASPSAGENGSAADHPTLHAGTVEILLGAGAQLTFVELQNWGRHVWNFTHERARVKRDGVLHWIFGAVGSRLTKNFSELSLDGDGAEGRMSGFYFADGAQHLDHDTQQNHMAPHTTSDLLFKGALVERSRSVWQGMIYVAPGAQKTDGYQANRNLILSKQARADSIPGLEILADDVRCTHGATVSQLEEDPIFYLMSRGLPRREAERLVVGGFFAPVMQRIPFEAVRQRFEAVIDNKLAGGV
jgi:Fe-S cluster assembly protein SufD